MHIHRERMDAYFFSTHFCFRAYDKLSLSVMCHPPFLASTAVEYLLTIASFLTGMAAYSLSLFFCLAVQPLPCNSGCGLPAHSTSVELVTACSASPPPPSVAIEAAHLAAGTYPCHRNCGLRLPPTSFTASVVLWLLA